MGLESLAKPYPERRIADGTWIKNPLAGAQIRVPGARLWHQSTSVRSGSSLKIAGMRSLIMVHHSSVTPFAFVPGRCHNPAKPNTS